MADEGQIENASAAISIVGFDSAWTDKPNAPGAICAIRIGPNGPSGFREPQLVSFAGALEFVRGEQSVSDLCLVAIDQPTIVPNLSSMRPVDRIAASIVNFCGGGVQPANRSKRGMFCDIAPIWTFKTALGAVEDPEAARKATSGLHLMEVFPALALPGFDPTFFGYRRGPRYNPLRKKTFRRQSWVGVATFVSDYAERAGLVGVSEWAAATGAVASPSKADQDRLDAVICALIGFHWRFGGQSGSLIIGDLVSGYMVAPVSGEMLDRLATSIATNKSRRPGHTTVS